LVAVGVGVGAGVGVGVAAGPHAIAMVSTRAMSPIKVTIRLVFGNRITSLLILSLFDSRNLQITIAARWMQ
jgi:hypothetical protein